MTDAKTPDAKTPDAPQMPDWSNIPMPEVKGGLVAYLQVDGAVKATEFYEKAFGATVAMVAPPDDKGRTMHAHVYINGSSLMMSDPFPEYGAAVEKVAGATMTIQLKEGIDGWWSRAVAAGCEAVMPVEATFWGARYGQVRDPFGILWAFNEPQKR